MLLSLGSATCSFVVPNAMLSDGLSARVAHVCREEGTAGRRAFKVEDIDRSPRGFCILRSAEIGRPNTPPRKRNDR